MLEFSRIDKDFMVYKNNRVYLFGAAKLGKQCKNILEKKGVQVCGFIDNDKKKQGMQFQDLPVISFEDFLIISRQERHTVVQIASRYECEMIAQMEESGYDSYISYAEFAVRTKQLSMYLATRENKKLRQMIYKCDVQANLRAPILAMIKNYYFGRKRLVERETFDIMLSAFTVGNHAILETDDGKGLIALNHSYKWMDEESWNVLKEGKVRVVIGVGDPIAQNISLMYQICENDFWDMEEFWMRGGGVQRIFDEYIIGSNQTECWYNFYKKEAGSNFLIQDFFEQQVEPFLGVDLYHFAFDKEKGYSIIYYGNLEIFIYQVEKISSVYGELADFLEAESKEVPFNKDMLEDSWLERQWYGRGYRRAKKELVISRAYFEECYSSKYIRHFYDDADIEVFKNKWKHNIR